MNLEVDSMKLLTLLLCELLRKLARWIISLAKFRIENTLYRYVYDLF